MDASRRQAGVRAALLIAFTRSVPPSIVNCELTYLKREPINLARAVEQHGRYEACLTALGYTVQRLPSLPNLPDSVLG